jgi:hypothetical protein
MKIVDAIGVFIAGLITVAALSLILAPNSQMASVVKAFGDAGSELLKTAKNYPTGG